MTEFELIDRYFGEGRLARGAGLAASSAKSAKSAVSAVAPVLGIGDDCALLSPPRPGQVLAISTDMLVEGRHFFAGTPAAAIGHKALAVNLSDLAAMGAEPLGFTLALALPTVDEAWLEGFSRGLFDLAERWQCPLIGGDTTGGPLCISITVLGAVAAGGALRRDGAQPGDDIWVSGALGGAAAAVAERQAGRRAAAAAAERLDWPRPRMRLGPALAGVARSAIDLSDGLSGDLAHILKASGGLGAELLLSAIPLDAALTSLPLARQQALALGGGDDYELLFTASPSVRAQIETLKTGDGFDDLGPRRIGTVVVAPGIRLLDAAGAGQMLVGTGFDHFADEAGR